MSEIDRTEELVSLTADVVSAYVQKNVVPAASLAELIASVHASFKALGTGSAVQVAEEVRQQPAVPIKKSVNPEAITCLECGRGLKSLKRHLSTHHELSPEEYREKWRLPKDYPMTAPEYSVARSKLAVSSGLGQRRLKAPSAKKKA
ncbi:MucR family transcriptional regulator [Pseudorhizobium flavum]|uniref:MucR family transcriptional regulator n=1 Tax=Pseudorhizobium flavum TaxID=1335061 RepID=UPI00376FFDC1